MYIQRTLNIAELLDKKSHFLWGPRQTGKTSLIRQSLPEALTFNLLESETFLELSNRPSVLREQAKTGSLVVIDEIQKLPSLLDEVQLLIEEKSVRFLLTGSSARKLKRTGTNLLGGRARSRQLYPLSSYELKKHFDLNKAINRGLLPSIYFSDDPEEDLKSYIGDYLSQEIAAEAAIRNIPAFSRFIHVAGHFNAKQINFEKLSLDAQVAPSTIRGYFQILNDTMLGSVLPSWKHAGRTREVSIGKFYFFDTGLARKLQERGPLVSGTPEFGDAFEAFIHHELKCYLEYKNRDGSLHFWRTHTGQEVDFVLNENLAIEVKSSKFISGNDMKGLLAIKELYPMKRLILVSFESHARTENGVEIMPWKEFLEKLWGDEIAG